MLPLSSYHSSELLRKRGREPRGLSVFGIAPPQKPQAVVASHQLADADASSAPVHIKSETDSDSSAEFASFTGARRRDTRRSWLTQEEIDNYPEIRLDVAESGSQSEAHENVEEYESCSEGDSDIDGHDSCQEDNFDVKPEPADDPAVVPGVASAPSPAGPILKRSASPSGPAPRRPVPNPVVQQWKDILTGGWGRNEIKADVDPAAGEPRAAPAKTTRTGRPRGRPRGSGKNRGVTRAMQNEINASSASAPPIVPPAVTSSAAAAVEGTSTVSADSAQTTVPVTASISNTTTAGVPAASTNLALSGTTPIAAGSSVTTSNGIILASATGAPASGTSIAIGSSVTTVNNFSVASSSSAPTISAPTISAPTITVPTITAPIAIGTPAATVNRNPVAPTRSAPATATSKATSRSVAKVRTLPVTSAFANGPPIANIECNTTETYFHVAIKVLFGVRSTFELNGVTGTSDWRGRYRTPHGTVVIWNPVVGGFFVSVTLPIAAGFNVTMNSFPVTCSSSLVYPGNTVTIRSSCPTTNDNSLVITAGPVVTAGSPICVGISFTENKNAVKAADISPNPVLSILNQFGDDLRRGTVTEITYRGRHPLFPSTPQIHPLHGDELDTPDERGQADSGALSDRDRRWQRQIDQQVKRMTGKSVTEWAAKRYDGPVVLSSKANGRNRNKNRKWWNKKRGKHGPHGVGCQCGGSPYLYVQSEHDGFVRSDGTYRSNSVRFN